MRGRLYVESVVPEHTEAKGGVVPRSPRSRAPCCGGTGACALLVVANQSTRSLWSFNVKGSATGEWGVDVLEGAILPGESRAWELAPGTYHLRVETAGGTRLHHFGLELRAGQLARWMVEENGG